MRTFARPLCLISLVFLGWATFANGQGLIVDRRPEVPVAGSYEVREVNVDARIRDQVAEVQVTQTFHNPGSFELESEYLFPLPDEGAVQNFVFLVDGREITGRVLPKDEARRIYEDIVRHKRDPALLEYMGQGLIRTSVFPIPPHASRTVTMRYTQICKRDHELIQFAYPFATQKFTRKPIERLGLSIRLDSKEPIKSIYCPSHEVDIKREGDHEATVKLVQRDVIPTDDFRLIYTLGEGAVGATVLSYRPGDSEDGYMLVLASPAFAAGREEKPAKTVVFVLDRSGSMSGQKIEQARNALRFVLDNLREGDTFNILAYDDRVESYKPELQRFSDETRRDALKWVDNIYPGGSTNIDEALRGALRMIGDRSRPSYVLFLTDGIPTAGETNEAAIAKHAKEVNESRTRVFAFGVGYDVNARLLDRISGGNGGTSEYVKPDQNIESSVSRFFRKMTSPVLADLKVTIAGLEPNRTYPRDIPDLFEGGQLVWVGRYREVRDQDTHLKIEGRVGDEVRRFEFPAKLARAGEGSGFRFVETLWAVRRIGYLIDQIDLNGQNKELTDELVELSKKYGILTPYTSFLADERAALLSSAEHEGLARDRLDRLNTLGGRSGVAQREFKGRYQNAERGGFGATGAMAGKPGEGNSDLAKRQYNLALRGAQTTAAGVSATARPLELHDFAMSPAANALPVLAEDSEGNTAIVSNARRVGEKTFFKRGERWVDSTVTPELEGKSKSIEQFSDAYFDLARSQTPALNQYLTFEEPVTVNLNGQVYKIDRSKSRE
jgi:Ca-activated chloride channel family protein